MIRSILGVQHCFAYALEFYLHLEAVPVDGSQVRKSFPLRLSRTVSIAVRDAAKAEGISLNHYIEIALAEKLSRTATFSPPPSRSLPDAMRSTA